MKRRVNLYLGLTVMLLFVATGVIYPNWWFLLPAALGSLGLGRIASKADGYDNWRRQ